MVKTSKTRRRPEANLLKPDPTASAPSQSLRTQVVGILNVTPDSFWDGGRYTSLGTALARAEEMVREGADWVDVGGSSSRPGAAEVPYEEERARVLPVLKGLVKSLPIPLSLDTSRYEIIQEALDLGVRMINDIRALRSDERLPALVARYEAFVVLMHMQGEPRTMQERPHYTDVVGDIKAFFEERVALVQSAGVRSDKIILDPGIGFGKTAGHNLEILRRLAAFGRLGYPLMVGPSRKSVIGQVLDVPAGERLHGTSALVALSIQAGARYVRVHDVREMVQVARMTDAVVAASTRNNII
ncbi:MAG: dihydropteroate synthase [Candidatus Omnitrophica bacterium]|nr:dihydropteroate synthase [Candidatus Omnitrophota bacterium]